VPSRCRAWRTRAHACRRPASQYIRSPHYIIASLRKKIVPAPSPADPGTASVTARGGCRVTQAIGPDAAGRRDVLQNLKITCNL
ncbi:MAG: hypothetical protein NC117_03905, partial [Pseudoflavonifractor sp.]|nr:hypothetical protein [Pseudoflavonifractor sp.]